MKRSPLAMFITKLKELEFVYRQKTMKKIGQGVENVSVEEPKFDKLPFQQFFPTSMKMKTKLKP